VDRYARAMSPLTTTPAPPPPWADRPTRRPSWTPSGAVLGTSGLRVVDASIIPDTPSTVLNLTVMMLAERVYQRVYQT
jgi:GMC oxidoreductase